MMYLYNKLTTDFSVNGQPIRNAYDAYVVRGEGFQLRFNLLLDENEEYKLIKKEMIISAMTPDGENYFRVWDIVLHSTHVEIIALQLMYDFDNKLVKSFAVNRATGQTVINVFKNNFKSSLGNFTISSSVQEVHDFTLDDMNDAYNALEVLQRIAVRWDSELSVDGYDIRMIKRLGKRTNALLHENKNISEFEDTSTTRGLATRIYAKSTFRASDGDEEDTIIEVTVDSPLINEYSQIYEKHYTNNDARTEQELINWVNLKYSTDNMDKPKRTIESATHIIDGTEINYGDDLVLKYHSHDVDEVIRCMGYEYDPLTETFYGITLGGFRQSYTDAISNRVVDLTENINLALRERMNQIANEVQIVTATANGFNRETWGPNPVPNPREGDKWFYFTLDRPNEVEFRQYDGTKWVTLMDDYYGERVKKRIEEVEGEAEKLADDITEAHQSADDAKRDAGLALTASEALEIITQETASQLLDTRGLLATVESNASEAWAKADSAVTQAGQAITDAYTAQTTAQSAISQAQSALSKANSVEETTNSLVLDVDNLAGEVALKAGKSIVDTLSGTVSTHATTLSQQATAISSKAEKSVVDTLSGTVSTHTSTLSQHAKDISARLTQSQVDSLVDGKGLAKITYVDSQIGVTAESFGVELTRVEGKIDGLQIGGTNLLKNTSKTFKTINTTPYYNAVDGGEVKNLSEYGVSVGDTITFRVYIKSTSGHGGMARLTLWNDAGAQVAIGGNAIQNGQEGYSTVTTTIGSDRTRLHVGIHNTVNNGVTSSILEYKEPKLEKGNKTTNWSPAPEDTLMQNDFTVFKNSYQSTVNSINSELSKTAKTTDLNGMVTEAYLATNQYAKQGEINTQLQSYLKTTDLEGKVQSTSAFQDIKATTDRFTRVIGSTDEQAKANIAQIVMTDSLFQTTIRENVTGGGVNRYKKSTSFHAGAGIQSFSKNNLNGFNVAGGSSSPRQLRMNGVIDSNGWWTISGWFRGIQSININFTIDITDSAYSEPFYAGTANEWQYFEVTRRVVGYSSVYNFIDINLGGWAYYEFKDIMVEKGKIAHDWSPAPEDMATSQQLSDVKQTADSIQALVGTTNESVARAVMTSSLWETEVASEIESALESTTESKTIYPEVAIVSGLDLNLFGRGSGSYRETSRYVEAITTAESLRVYVTIDPDGEDLGGNGTLQVIYGGVSSNVATIYKSLRNYEYFFTLEVPADANRGGSFTFRYVIDGTAYRWGAIKKVAVYRTEVVEEETGTGAIASKISQLSNLISLALTGSEGGLSSLALSARGVSIKGEIINLDGKVKMTEAFAKKFMVEEMTADTVEAFTGTFANVIANNIDVNNIAGNKASFIQLLLNGTTTALRATSSVVDIMRNDGSISTRLTQNGMEIWRDGSKVGDFESRSSISESGALTNKKSISMTPERDSYISLGYYKSGETKSTRVLSVAGDTGRIYIGSALYPSESSTYGLQIQRYTLNSSGGIRVGSTGGSSGIFIGDFGHVSIQFNGIWYAMDRLIN